jgi:hypothetical protein
MFGLLPGPLPLRFLIHFSYSAVKAQGKDKPGVDQIIHIATGGPQVSYKEASSNIHRLLSDHHNLSVTSHADSKYLLDIVPVSPNSRHSKFAPLPYFNPLKSSFLPPGFNRRPYVHHF